MGVNALMNYISILESFFNIHLFSCRIACYKLNPLGKHRSGGQSSGAFRVGRSGRPAILENVRMKIAIIEASHWHVPLYLDALEMHQVARVTAVSDETSMRGPQLAARFGAAHYVDWR